MNKKLVSLLTALIITLNMGAFLSPIKAYANEQKEINNEEIIKNTSEEVNEKEEATKNKDKEKQIDKDSKSEEEYTNIEEDTQVKSEDIEKKVSKINTEEYKFTLEPGKNYEFINKSSTDIYLYKNTDWQYDYVKYNSQGETESYDQGVSHSIYIYPNGKIKLTNTDDKNIYFYVNGEEGSYIELKEVKNPTFYSFNMVKNKHYMVKNKDLESVKVINTSSKTTTYDRIYYSRDEVIKDFELNKYNSSLTLYIEEYMFMTPNNDSGITLYIPYDYKDSVSFIEQNNDLIKYFTFEKNKSYEMKYGGKYTAKVMLYGDTKFSIVKYHDNTSIDYSNPQENENMFYFYTNDKAKILSKNEDLKLALPLEQYNKMDIKEIEGEIIKEFVLEKGKTYEIQNGGKIEGILYGETVVINTKEYGAVCEAVRYNNDGAVISMSTRISGIDYIDENCKTIAMPLEVDYNCWLPMEQYNNITIKEINHRPIYTINTEEGKSYSFENTSNETLKFDIEQNNMNLIYFNADKSVDYMAKGLNRSWMIIEKGQYGRFTALSDGKIYLAYDKKDFHNIKETSTPALYEINMEVGKTYEIKNNSTKLLSFDSTPYYNTYDYIKYKLDNTYKLYTDRYGGLELEKGERILVSPKDDNKEITTFYMPYEFKSESLISVKEGDINVNDIFDLIPKIKVDIRKNLSKIEGSEGNYSINDSLNNYRVSLYNKTQNRNLYISTRNNYIVLNDEEVKIGDEIEVTLKSNNEDCNDFKTTIKLNNNLQGNISAVFSQQGYIKVDLSKENLDNGVIRYLLFNNEGKNIERRTSYRDEVIVSSSLQEGQYTVVLLKCYGDLWQVNSLDELTRIGFEENKDYTKYVVNVENEKISLINPESINKVDEEKLSFFDKENTSFTSNTQSISTDGLLELRLEYKFKNQYTTSNISDKNIEIKLPIEVAYVENSIILDNEKVNCEVGDGYIIVPINKMSGTIKFYVRPARSGDVKFTASARFKFNNKYMEEVLGIASTKINYLIIGGPTETSSKKIRVHGIAPGATTVAIYDGDVEVGRALALKNGVWNKDIELINAFNGSNHNLSIKVVSGAVSSEESNILKVKYNSKSPQIDEFLLLYDGKKLDLTNNINSNSLKEYKTPMVIFNSLQVLTFKIKINNQDNVDKVYVVSTKDDEVYKMEATYDTTKDIWIASGYFNPNNVAYLPGNISVQYEYKNISESLGKVDFESEEFKESLPDEWKNAKVKKITDTPTECKIQYTLDDKNKTSFTIETKTSAIPSNLTQSNILSKGYTQIGSDKYLLTLSDDEYELVDYGNKIKTDIMGTIIHDVLEEIDGEFGTVFGPLGVIKSAYDFSSDFVRYEEYSRAHPELKSTVDALQFLNMASFYITYASLFISISNPSVAVVVMGVDTLLDYMEYALRIKFLMEAGYNINIRYVIDPSGYVYEGVASNRVAGVTTTVYYKDEGGNAVLWDASEYEQENPLITDENGMYLWNVPEGQWQVKYEKEGYETTYSDWLPVPPPQTEVNIGVVSKAKPSIELFNMYKDRGEITFNKYMDISTINTNSIKLKDESGKEVPITIEPVNSEKSPITGKTLARKFILKTGTSTSNKYTVLVKTSAKTYADISSSSELSKAITYKELPEKINVNSSFSCDYNKTIKIPVSINNISNASEFKLTANSSIDDIVSVVNKEISFDKDGKAYVSVTGNLPGKAEITLKIEGTDLVATTKITVYPANGEVAPNTPPTISVSDKTIKVGDSFDVRSGVSASDTEDRDLTSKIQVIGSVDISKAGTYKITYKVADRNGTEVSKEITVTVRSNAKPVIKANNQTIDVGSYFNVRTGISASDVEDGDLTSKVQVIGSVDTSKAGTYKITYKVTDSDDNEVIKSINVVVKYKTFTTFTINDVKPTSTYISGKGKSGAYVKAYVNGKQIGKTSKVSTDGSYKIYIPKQSAKTKITVKISKTGYISVEKTTNVYYRFTIFTVNSVKSTSTYISGKGKSGADVKAYINGKQIGKTAKVSSKGDYKIYIPKQSGGKKIVIKMSKANYESVEKTITVYYVFSTFTVNSVKSTSTYISGKGKSGAYVKAYVSGKQIGKTAEVSSKGDYKIYIPKQSGGKKIVIKMSKTNYESVEKTITVYYIFSTFTVNSVKSTSTYISGKGKSGAYVKAYVNGKQIGKTVKVSYSGSYKISIPKQKKGKKVVVKISKSGYVDIEKSISVK